MKKMMGSLLVMMSTVMPALANCHYGMRGGGCYGHGGSGMAYGPSILFLLGLALGYWLLRLAENENKKILKMVGRTVSWITLIVSLAGLLCKAASVACQWHKECKAGSAHCGTANMQAEAEDDDEADVAPGAPIPAQKK